MPVAYVDPPRLDAGRRGCRCYRRCPLPDSRRTATNGSPRERRQKSGREFAPDRWQWPCHGVNAGATVDRPLDPDVTRRQTPPPPARWAAPRSRSPSSRISGCRRWSRPASRAIGIRTAIVERGPVDATISATGLVVPEVEQVITSPVEARVLRVLERAGREARGRAADPRSSTSARAPRRRQAHAGSRHQGQRADAEAARAGEEPDRPRRPARGEGAAARLARSAAASATGSCRAQGLLSEELLKQVRARDQRRPASS